MSRPAVVALWSARLNQPSVIVVITDTPTGHSSGGVAMIVYRVKDAC